jgi:hypothetical protein
MKNPWKIRPHTKLNKSFTIEGPGDVLLAVDYDDVDHRQVEVDMQRAVEILNREWIK